MRKQPPHFLPRGVAWLVKRFCRKAYHDEVLGDLEELYAWRLESYGSAKARLRLYMDMLSAIRLIRIENKTTVTLNFLAMISLKVTLRTFMRNKLHTAINLFGLACGFMVFLAIYQYVSFEQSYESFNPKAEQVYRINSTLMKDSVPVFKTSLSMPPLGQEAAANIPGVNGYAKLFHAGAANSCVITLGNDLTTSFNEEKVMFATQEAPAMLALSLVEGIAETVLDQPNEVLISKSLQQKYFQGASALGRTLIFDDDDENHHVLTVSGVFEDYPGNSHLEFDLLISFQTLFSRDGRGDRSARFVYEENWDGRNQFITYLVIAPGTDLSSITTSLKKKADAAIPYPDYTYAFELVPVSDIHLGEGFARDVKAVADVPRLRVLFVLGVAVLLLAWVNFINLTTATALGRAKETGMRKVLGGTRNQLVYQFLFESLVTGMLALSMGLVLFYWAFPYINEFLPVSHQWFLFQEWGSTLTVLAIGLGTSLLAGIYPALVLSGFKPVVMLRGKFKSSKKGLLVRRTLVVFQGAISIFLITGLFAIVSQVNFMIDKHLGMDTEQVLVIEKPGLINDEPGESYDEKALFNTQLADKPFIKGYAVTDGLPGSRLRKGKDINLTEDEDNEVEAWAVHVEYDYLNTLGITMMAGRDFVDAKTDAQSAILNESALHALGLNDPMEVLNKRIYDGDEWLTVIGVINDYHHTSLKKGIVPMLIKTRSRGLDYHLIKMTGGDLVANLEQVEAAFHNVFPGNPFDYYFLDQHFIENYREEQQFGRAFAFFALVALLIASVGLFSLSTFVTMSRLKEIGVRKVLGARVLSILGQLNKEFMLLVLVAILVATPLSVWLVNDWLSSFPYRIGLGLGFFVLPGLSLLLICLFSVSVKTLAASRLNPVKLLRDQ